MHPHGHPNRDQRGASLSAYVAVVVFALLAVAGLVVDGGAKISALRSAESAAAQAARAGADAGATSRASGSALDLAAVEAAASGVLADRGVDGGVRVEAGRVTVTTHTSTPTVFLGLLGIGELTATGEASADLRTP